MRCSLEKTVTEIPLRTGCFWLAVPSETGVLPEYSCSIKSHFPQEHNVEVYLTRRQSRSPKDFCNTILVAAQHITFGERAYEWLSNGIQIRTFTSLSAPSFFLFFFFFFWDRATLDYSSKTLQQFNTVCEQQAPIAPPGFMARNNKGFSKHRHPDRQNLIIIWSQSLNLQIQWSQEGLVMYHCDQSCRTVYDPWWKHQVSDKRFQGHDLV